MKNIPFLIILCTCILWSCNGDTSVPIAKTTLWPYEHHMPYDRNSVLVCSYDSTEEYGGSYLLKLEPLRDISAYTTLEQYVLQTIDSSITVLRVVNELHINDNFLIPLPDSLEGPPGDYWNKRVPYLLGEVCFVLQSTPGRVRFVYLKDRYDSTSLVDTTVEYTGLYIQRFASYPVDSTNEVRLGYARSQNSGNRLFNLMVSVWTTQRSYHIHSRALWYYADCGHPSGWIAAEGKDQHLVYALLQMACDIRSVGGFQAKYGYRTMGEVRANERLED